MEYTKAELRILKNAASSYPDQGLRIAWMGWITLALAVVVAVMRIANDPSLNTFSNCLLFVALVGMTAAFVRFKTRALLLIRKIGSSEIAAQI